MGTRIYTQTLVRFTAPLVATSVSSFVVRLVIDLLLSILVVEVAAETPRLPFSTVETRTPESLGFRGGGGGLRLMPPPLAARLGEHPHLMFLLQHRQITGHLLTILDRFVLLFFR